MKKLIGLMLVSLSALVFTGCNTMDGAGQDIERGGEEIQDAAN